MKKTLAVKALCILIAVLVIASLLASCSNSEDKVRAYKWEISSNGEVIWNSDRTYYKYEIPLGYVAYFCPVYSFQNCAELDYKEYDIYSYARDGEIITVDYSTQSDECYVTDTGRQYIEQLVSGEREKIYFYDYDYEVAYPIDRDLLNRLNSIDEFIEIDVTELRSLKEYTLRRYDESFSVYRESGAIYEYKNALWYVNYDELPNENFSSDGHFSYRSGTVPMYQIISDAELYFDLYDALEDGEDVSYRKILERKDIKPEREKMDPETRAKAWFWSMYCIMAFALPVWPLTIGILNARSKKHGRSKLWMIQSLAALVWIAIGLLTLMILI